MGPRIRVRSQRRWLGVVALFVLVSALPVGVKAADDPKPDPTGAATGDRTSVTDAAGTPFVGTDAAFKDQAAKEPLAMKLADGVGHLGSPRTPHGRSTPATSSCSCRPGSRS